MIVKLLTKHRLEFLSIKEAAQACLSLHIVGNYISLLILFAKKKSKVLEILEHLP